MRSDADLISTVALTLIAAVVTATVDAPVLRIAAGILLVLLLPGYAITALVVDRRQLDVPERLLMAVGASLVMSVLGGLILDLVLSEMGRTAWSVLLLLVTTTAAGAAIRWPARDHNVESRPRRTVAVARAGTRAVASNVASLILAGTLAVAAIAIAGHAADRTPGFAELSSLPTSSAHDPRMLITIRSRRSITTSYLLEIREDDRMKLRRRLTLAPQQLVRILTPAARSSTHVVVVTLSRPGSRLYTAYYLPGRRAPQHIAAAPAGPGPRATLPLLVVNPTLRTLDLLRTPSR